MKKLMYVILVGAVSSAAHSQGNVEQSLWTQALVAIFPLVVLLGLSVIAFKIFVKILKPWLDRHVEALEKIEQHLSTIAGTDASKVKNSVKTVEPPSEDKWAE